MYVSVCIRKAESRIRYLSPVVSYPRPVTSTTIAAYLLRAKYKFSGANVRLLAYQSHFYVQLSQMVDIEFEAEAYDVRSNQFLLRDGETCTTCWTSVICLCELDARLCAFGEHTNKLLMRHFGSEIIVELTTPPINCEY